MNKEKQKTNPCDEVAINPVMPGANVQKGNRAGDLCPICHTERLDYNGLMILVCPVCGQIEGGCFT
jgi:ribosomal protein L37AE/L43A